MGKPDGGLARKVIDVMHRAGAYTWKVHGNEYTPAGLPDVVGVYRGQFVGIETKAPGGKLSEAQQYRIKRLQTAGALVLAPCFDLDSVRQFLADLDSHLIGETPPGRAPGYISLTYGRGWTPPS